MPQEAPAHYDPQNGAPITSSMPDYVVAVNADVPKLEVHFLDYPDLKLNAVGARGIGEIGLAGIAVATHQATACVEHTINSNNAFVE